MSDHFLLFDSLLEPTFVLNREGMVIYCNETAALLLDSTPKRVLRSQKKLHELLIFEKQPQFISALHIVTDSTPYEEVRFTVSGIEKTGRVQLTCQKMKCDIDNAYLVFCRDVTLEETLQKKYHRELEQKQSYIEELEKARVELENYSKNLEKMVQERTLEITKLNDLLGALIDSLDQGFLIFDPRGSVLPVTSRACEDTLECDPKSQFIWDVLRLKPEQADSFKKWMLTAFSEMLPFEDLAPLAPSTYSHSRGKTIHLSYYPMRSEDQKIEGIVLVATDQTELVAAQKQAEQEKAHVSMVLKLIKQKRQILKFVSEAKELLHHLERDLKEASPKIEGIFRTLHTLKGASALFSIQPVVDACHRAEESLHQNNLDQCKEWSKVAQHAFAHFIDEAQTILGPLQDAGGESIEVRADALISFSEKYLEPGSSASKEFFRNFLFKPSHEFFKHYNEPLQELAQRLHKQLNPLHITPPHFQILGKPYVPLFQEFIHAFRNSIDHGIELPEERLAAGKMPEGQIRIHFETQPSNQDHCLLKITIQDDGKGIDPSRVREKLTAKGIAHQELTDEAVLQFVLSPQFSTRDTVSEVSGRGVGLDALAAQVLDLGGKIWVESTLGKGTKIQIEVPWIEEVTPAFTESKAS